MNMILETARTVWASFPLLLKVAITLAFGWILANLLKFLVSNLLLLLRFDVMSRSTGISEFLRKGNVGYSPSRLVGVLAYWICILLTFFQISRTLDIRVVTTFGDQLLETLPGVFAAVLIMVIGFIFISFLANFTLTIARNAAVPNARLLSRSIKYVGNILLIIIAFDQIGFGRSVLNTFFQLLFGALVFGFALAFGLGCKDLARGAMERFLRDLKERERSSGSSDLEG